MPEYPTIIYKCPGPHKAHDGQTYQYKSAKSADDIAAGWYESLQDAVNAANGKKAVSSKQSAEDQQNAVETPKRRGRPPRAKK